MFFLKHALFVLVVALSCLSTQRFATAIVPQDEVDALEQIAKTMGATDWEFNPTTCTLETVGVMSLEPPADSVKNITCNCQFENNTCHIEAIEIKRFSLPGVLPPELVQLPYLQKIDFAYNYLSGSIPIQWASMALKSISVLGNRLSGEIPKDLGNFSNLTYLSLEANQFSGTIPSELGKLVNLETLMLSSNNLSGNLPEELGGLENLTDFRVNDNNLNGTIPDFIQNWKQLKRLEMIASGLKGPIPLSISVLEKLTDLRISDINGTIQSFPDLGNMTGLTRIILRNCNISGEIPDYIWTMNHLRILDLSFNKLSGELPTAISTASIKFIFLSSNLLSGNVPESILIKGTNVDLSYNNFTRQSIEQPACNPSGLNLNLFRSSSQESGFQLDLMYKQRVQIWEFSDRSKESLEFFCGVPDMFFLKHALFVLVVALSCLSTQRFATAIVPQDEVDALEQIAKTMGATDWEFNPTTCTLETVGVMSPEPPADSVKNITCNCQFENNTCHIEAIEIKRFSLPGVLPPELVQLPYLQKIDFAYNYLSGSIPIQWASMALKSISVLGNRLSGEIPKDLGNFSNLTYLSLEANQFSGTIPSELGKLVNLETVMLSSNNLSGNLPEELGGLKNLTDFRVNDNNLNGTIPDFIQNWKQLKRLEMIASGLKGPIPLSISVLEKLTDLRISDINGTIQSFPDLRNMTGLTRIILRNCNISGKIPDYIWRMNHLRILDLSFNKLSGELPTAISTVNIKFIFLSSNLLSGNVPESILIKGTNVDLSYNNFTRQSIEQPACNPSGLNLNLFRSSSQESGLRAIRPCMEDFTCPRYWHSLYINCGGDDIEERDIVYKGDAAADDGAARFFPSGNDNWGLSSTGDFMDDDDFLNTDYIATLPSPNISALYTTARVSPLSLTYYRYCLEKGNYTVSLHFAEIKFTNDKTYNSLGRRLFDIYIQDILVEKDFNIVAEAPGVVTPVIKKFNASVTENILEIRFYWAGKGTTRIPAIGVYGPLISAISVDPNFIPRSEGGKAKIAPIIVGVVVPCLIFLALGIFLWRRYFKAKTGKEKDFKGLELQTASFSLKQINVATNNFDPANKIGEGGFGPVYKGLLSNGTVIAVKQLSSKSSQGNREFLNEIGMISCLQHPNLVKLYGCCIEGNQMLLVYEYMENNSLSRALFGSKNHQLKLDWPTRQKICVGIAKGIAFLHDESRLKIVHRDIKGTNVLLDRDLNPKISDFGLARLEEGEKTHISTRVAGTIGYMAPEYALWGYLTYKADVYSFGIVALEIVSGKHNMSYGPASNCACLLDWACQLQQNGSLMELIDEKLGSEFNKEEAERMIKVAFLCTDASPSIRPTMAEVVSMLEGTSTIPEMIPEASSYSKDLRFKAIRDSKSQIHSQSLEGSQAHVSTSVGSWRGSSSTSAHDLYEITDLGPSHGGNFIPASIILSTTEHLLLTEGKLGIWMLIINLFGFPDMFFLKHALFVSVVALSCLSTLRFATAMVPQDEVDALQQIAKTMGATYWEFNATSCKLETVGVTSPEPPAGSEKNITCNCQFHNNTCHIVAIEIKRFSLPGVLPPELVQLPYLQDIDFAYNYLSGSIPIQWGSMELNFISVLGNRLSGEIPKDLRNFRNLTYLNLEANQFSGTLPSELGKLVNLETLMLSSNNLIGNLPEELGGLKNLTDFRVNDNNLSGTIPDFIQNWKQLERIEMIASGLKGPIPSSISVLEKLKDLRISDINVTIQAFPELRNMTGLTRIILRNCNISGEIPDYIWRMNHLRILDLSFNKLSGELPTVISTNTIKFIFLTGNLLSGNVPESILKKGTNVDLSYNNFVRQSAEQPACQTSHMYLNLFRSSMQESGLRAIRPCKEDFKCPRYWSSLHINCGGDDIEERDIVYEGDAGVNGGAARFFSSDNENWGLSSTGDFMDDNDFLNVRYISTRPLQNVSALYTTARISPLSLTYYRYCLENGNYNVSLHFVETQFTNDTKYNSLGRRIFDIYIQDILVEKDFTMEAAEPPTDVVTPIIKKFSASVTENILEIRFYWAGKGTTRIPATGVYGPLISAISVDPNFTPRSEGGKALVVVGILGFCIIFLELGIICWRRYFKLEAWKEKGYEQKPLGGWNGDKNNY
ncbi:uncharacterized protein LOC132169331 [Corylus avellana]|uniref:uncharacterized protein LOC132169331 n=1 Tax=Corylus avellana TaxID=13451 RepID=UPI00286BC31A|nr:uncharacterized protein LOC132169331 [Corylus avellana]